MRFTDIFIKRPVLASVVSLMLIVMGVGGIVKMPLREYPKMENTTIVVTTAYPGASPQVMQGFITTVLEKSIASANGIDYMTATSTLGVSTITIYVKLNYPPDDALTEVTGQVSAVRSQLPTAAESPVIVKQTGQTMPDLVLGFSSKSLSPEQVTAYVNNVIIPKVYGLGGVSQVVFWGQKAYAMRIWLDTHKMSKLGVTPTEVYQALANNNIQASAGQMKSRYVLTDINISTDLHTAQQFNNIVVKNDNGHLIRIKDVGKAVMAAQDYNSQVYFKGKKAIFIGLTSAPGANPLDVVGKIQQAMPTWRKALPPGLNMYSVYNSTQFIKAAISEVIHTIVEATVIVIIVIFLFLGAFRSVIIPVVAIPLSLIGVCFFMFALGFSLNLLTFLAMVIAIGLVVDDAIVVLENIYRHVEEGLTPFQASIKGAREIAGPVIVMTTTLVAVFAPIGFTGGVTGSLFKEFAFTLAAAVLVSGIVALTLSPMLCSKIVTKEMMSGRIVRVVDGFFNWLKNAYQRIVHWLMGYRYAVLLIAVLVLGSCFVMIRNIPTEFAPTEDQGFIGVMASAPSWSTLDYLQKYNPAIRKVFETFPQRQDTFAVDGLVPNQYSIFSGMILKPWGDRKETQMQLAPQITKKLASAVPGMQAVAIQFPSLPGIPFGPGVQFVMKSTGTYQQIYLLSQAFLKRVMASGLFIYGQNNLRFDKPMLDMDINRSKAGDLGIDMNQIASAMSMMIGDNYINYFSNNGYSFQVIPQALRNYRWDPTIIKQIHIATQSGKLVPLSSIISSKMITQPSSLTQFNQLNSATLELAMRPGVTQGQAINYLLKIAPQYLPKSMTYDFAGSSRQYVQEGNTLMYVFIFAMIVIFLVLAAQFESFRDPFVILISVPMSICGALIPLYLGAATLNIYTEIGLIALIGLISKHGILMVEFANKLQEEQGYSVQESIVHAAAVRLRPVLMTTFSMVFGVLPLVFASGAGAVSRHDIGLVIAFGMAIGTFFTLFVLPTVYTFVAQDKRKHLEKISKIQIMPPEDKNSGE